MKLTISTPFSIAVDESDVNYVRAEDGSGAFGIQPGHVEFLTVLTISVLLWRNLQGRESFVAVRGGVLRVRKGELIEIATPEAVPGLDLEQLRHEVLSEIAKAQQAERSARSGALSLEQAAIRQLYRYLRPSDRPIPRGPAESPGGIKP